LQEFEASKREWRDEENIMPKKTVGRYERASLREIDAAFKASMQRTTARTAEMIKKTQDRVMAELERFSRPEPRGGLQLLPELADLADEAEQALKLSAARKDAVLRKIAKRLRSFDRRV
jgi:hypothetical protein